MLSLRNSENGFDPAENGRKMTAPTDGSEKKFAGPLLAHSRLALRQFITDAFKESFG
jgi:hypothetical protein